MKYKGRMNLTSQGLEHLQEEHPPTSNVSSMPNGQRISAQFDGGQGVGETVVVVVVVDSVTYGTSSPALAEKIGSI